MSMSLTKMTAAIFEIPLRMMEFPVLMSTAVMDAMLSSDWTGNGMGNRSERRRTHRRTMAGTRHHRRRS